MNRTSFYSWIREHSAVIGVIIAFLALLIAVMPVWHKDSDGDGYGDPEQYIWWFWAPSGYVKNGDDCYDSNAEVKPGQKNFFDKDRGDGSFDYDCDGEVKRQHTEIGECVIGPTNTTARQGWNERVPDVGQRGQWLVDCDRSLVHRGKSHWCYRLRGLPV